MSNGRKIPSNIENPFDIILISLCDKLIDYCYTLKITPNHVTIFRIFLSIFIFNDLFNTSNIIFPVFGTLIFYFLDCLDGHLARSTDQVTVLGDYLDHIADVSFLIIVAIYILIKKFPGKKIICIVLIILLYLMFVHMGLQQKNYKIIKEKESGCSFDHVETLDSLNRLHNFGPEHICWSRFFGCGTLILSVCFTIFWIQYNSKK